MEYRDLMGKKKKISGRPNLVFIYIPSNKIRFIARYMILIIHFKTLSELHLDQSAIAFSTNLCNVRINSHTVNMRR